LDLWGLSSGSEFWELWESVSEWKRESLAEPQVVSLPEALNLPNGQTISGRIVRFSRARDAPLLASLGNETHAVRLFRDILFHAAPRQHLGKDATSPANRHDRLRATGFPPRRLDRRRSSIVRAALPTPRLLAQFAPTGARAK
jgi:hypothetical protein